ncbi:hypothetical protein [Bacillus sp. REN10]|uniref:hypothetical protein n=1 Tax=Bacillus sp. REN10 TaxID=2782541 RepID=UPI00193BADC5|nr:hypothetical protein [Bacillus sp. REN10]
MERMDWLNGESKMKIKHLNLYSALGATIVFALIYSELFLLGGFHPYSDPSIVPYLLTTFLIISLVTSLCLIAYLFEIFLLKNKKQLSAIFYFFIGILSGGTVSLVYINYEFFYFFIILTTLTTAGSMMFYFIKRSLNSVILQKVLAISPLVVISLVYLLSKFLYAIN